MPTITSSRSSRTTQRKIDPSERDNGCETDEETALEWITRTGWESRVDEFRTRSAHLVQAHWTEIAAVAAELLRLRVLNTSEVEIIADDAAGVPDTGLDKYRSLAREDLRKMPGRRG